VGWEKVTCWSTKATISLKRVKIEEKLLWRVYSKSPTLFWMAPSATPYDFLFPYRLGFTTPTKTRITIISGTAKAIRISNFLCTFKHFQGTHIWGALVMYVVPSTYILLALRGHLIFFHTKMTAGLPTTLTLIPLQTQTFENLVNSSRSIVWLFSKFHETLPFMTFWSMTQTDGQTGLNTTESWKQAVIWRGKAKSATNETPKWQEEYVWVWCIVSLPIEMILDGRCPYRKRS